MLITNGEPDTRRRVSPVPREGVGNLLFDMKEKGAFSLPYDLLASREVENIFENSLRKESKVVQTKKQL